MEDIKVYCSQSPTGDFGVSAVMSSYIYGKHLESILYEQIPKLFVERYLQENYDLLVSKVDREELKKLIAIVIADKLLI